MPQWLGQLLLGGRHLNGYYAPTGGLPNPHIENPNIPTEEAPYISIAITPSLDPLGSGSRRGLFGLQLGETLNFVHEISGLVDQCELVGGKAIPCRGVRLRDCLIAFRHRFLQVRRYLSVGTANDDEHEHHETAHASNGHHRTLLDLLRCYCRLMSPTEPRVAGISSMDLQPRRLHLQVRQRQDHLAAGRSELLMSRTTFQEPSD